MTGLGSSAQTAMNLGTRSLWFEAGHGQTGAAQFSARGSNLEFIVEPTQAQFTLRKSDGTTASCTMRLVGAATTASISGNAELAGKVNYLLGNNPSQWQTGVPTFAQVRVEQIYPGVSVVYYGNEQQLEYDFNLAAGVNPNVIALRFEGAENIAVNSQGELVVSLKGGKIIQHQPVAYQSIHGLRQEITAGYKILDANTAVFTLGSYNHTLPLVIDPILSYSTFFGGNYGDTARAVAVDGSGSIYIAGSTLSTVFSNGIPFSTSGAFQTANHGGTVTGDAFVAKFNNSGSNLVYLTYLGGSGNETALGLAVDNSGNAYLTGWTDSPDFPTKQARQGTIGGQIFHGFYLTDAFVSELNSNGTALVYSTYLGGNNIDVATAIAVDTNGAAYITGYTSSTNFPVTTNAYRTHLTCTNNGIPNTYNFSAFVAKIAPNGTNLDYGSYLGGTNYDQATGIALDPAGNIYVAGFTASTNFPATNALTGFKHLNGSTTTTPAFDAFACRFQSNFASLVYSTYLGGTNNDQATAITADASGNAYVVGWTVSTNFPYTTNALTSFGTNSPSFVHTNTLSSAFATNAFLTKIQWDGTNTSIGFSAMFGGIGIDVANGVALDTNNNIYIVGSASSTNFPVTRASLIGSLRATNSGGSDVFVTAFKADGSALLYSTYLGGSQNDFGYGIAVDAAGNAYITGQTLSTNFPNFAARQKSLNGTNDAFLVKILPVAPTPLLAANLSGTNVVVSWPPLGEESPAWFDLQTTTNLPPTNSWVLTTNSPVFTNLDGTYGYKFIPTNQARFFRLLKH